MVEGRVAKIFVPGGHNDLRRVNKVLLEPGVGFANPPVDPSEKAVIRQATITPATGVETREKLAMALGMSKLRVVQNLQISGVGVTISWIAKLTYIRVGETLMLVTKSLPGEGVGAQVLFGGEIKEGDLLVPCSPGDFPRELLAIRPRSMHPFRV